MLSLSAVEKAVRAGKIEDARKELDRLNRKGKWGSCEPKHLANLLWRTGSATRGLRLLRQFFLEISAKKLRAKPEEAAEYAACLIRVGAFLEAEWILGLDEVAATPMASLYRGLSFVTRWDYERAIPSFLEFIATPKLSDYHLHIGYANLAASYVYERHHKKAVPVLRRLLHDSQLKKNYLLMGFVLEVAAADRVLSGDYKEARRFLDETGRKWAKADEYHRSLVEKWNALLALAEKGEVAGVEQVRKRAVELQEWETFRDCDKYIALWTRNEALFLKVYFGTPYPAFRERLRRDFGKVQIPSEYGASFAGGDKRAQSFRFMVDAGERAKRGMTSQNFALASLLSSDLYRPHRLATLFGWLHPDEHFNPDSIGKRMSQGIRRLNLWTEAQEIPITASELESTYCLEGQAPAVLWLPRPDDQTLTWQPLIVRLKKTFKDQLFSTSEATQQLGLARSSMVRHLQALVASGQLIQTGNGPASRYQLKALRKVA